MTITHSAQNERIPTPLKSEGSTGRREEDMDTTKKRPLICRFRCVVRLKFFQTKFLLWHCLKITEKVSFNIGSEASYVSIQVH